MQDINEATISKGTNSFMIFNEQLYIVDLVEWTRFERIENRSIIV